MENLIERLNEDQKEFLIFLINAKGDSSVLARKRNLKFFQLEFIKDLLDKDLSDLSELGQSLAKEISELI
jgi:hypothetical protein